MLQAERMKASQQLTIAHGHIVLSRQKLPSSNSSLRGWKLYCKVKLQPIKTILVKRAVFKCQCQLLGIETSKNKTE